MGKYYAYMPWSLDVAMVALPFVAVGNWMQKSDFFQQSSLFTLVIPFCIWIYFLKNGTYIELATRSYPLGFLSMVEAVAGSIVCVCSNPTGKLCDSILQEEDKGSLIAFKVLIEVARLCEFLIANNWKCRIRGYGFGIFCII